MNKNPIKCESCGKFIPYLQLEKGGGASVNFIPDTEITQEETLFRCKDCTEKHGIIESRQSWVMVPYYGSTKY